MVERRVFSSAAPMDPWLVAEKADQWAALREKTTAVPKAAE
jgi:hypothetical protein